MHSVNDQGLFLLIGFDLQFVIKRMSIVFASSLNVPMSLARDESNVAISVRMEVTSTSMKWPLSYMCTSSSTKSLVSLE